MKIKKIFKISAITFLTILIISLSFIAIYIHITLKDVKNLALSINEDKSIETQIIDINNNKKTLNNNFNTTIKINDLNDYTINAFIAIEDKDFYNHKGINPKRMIKASYVNLANNKITQGASTITQQLIKNKYLSHDRKISRKIKEIYLALKLETIYSKSEILEDYLNTIYFGHGAYGIEDASIRYFNKSAKDLNINESASLASIINSPSKYSPINNKDNLLRRRNLVLHEMKKSNYINDEVYNENINSDIIINEGVLKNHNTLDLYDNYVLNEASEILNTNVNSILSNGYKIYTYKDEEIQEKLNQTINNPNYYKENKYGNIADSLSIIIDNNYHGVNAIAGKSKYNLINIKRQPGSLIKPIVVFAPAFEKGIAAPCTQILDEKIDYNGYSPNNVGSNFYGNISVRDIVAKSLNIPTIKLAEKIGLDNCKKYGEMCGVTFNENDVGYALTLGGLNEGVTLKEITDAYSPFYNNGNYIKSSFIKEIKNKDNMTIYSQIMTEYNTYNTDTAYLMTETLKYSVRNGTSKKLSQLGFDIAGKTGTVAYKKTNQNTDAYSLGYTAKHTMSVWLGNYSMNPEFNLDGDNNGGTYATQIIADVFDKLYDKYLPENFIKPDSIIECEIDMKMLEEDNVIALANNTPERYKINEIFSKRYMPKITSDKFNKIEGFDFNIESNNSYIKISFLPLEYLEYYIYREDNNECICIDKVLNANSKYEFIDKDVKNNHLYNYYIVVKNKYNDNITFTTEKKEIIINKTYNNLINREMNSHWIFA